MSNKKEEEYSFIGSFIAFTIVLYIIIFINYFIKGEYLFSFSFRQVTVLVLVGAFVISVFQWIKRVLFGPTTESPSDKKVTGTIEIKPNITEIRQETTSTLTCEQQTEIEIKEEMVRQKAMGLDYSKKVLENENYRFSSTALQAARRIVDQHTKELDEEESRLLEEFPIDFSKSYEDNLREISSQVREDLKSSWVSANLMLDMSMRANLHLRGASEKLEEKVKKDFISSGLDYEITLEENLKNLEILHEENIQMQLKEGDPIKEMDQRLMEMVFKNLEDNEQWRSSQGN